MNQNLTEIHFKYFTIDLPKSTVGGDFYLIKEKNNKTFIALADSSGHGISGGFLSALGIEYLNAAINKFSNLNDILKFLNINFYNFITKSEPLSHESLCISLICIENTTVYYGGSKHKIWKYDSKNESLTEFKTNNRMIGFYENIEFEIKSFNFENQDIIYLSSDGYPDQFGSGNKGKLKYTRFRKLLLESSKLSISDIKDHLTNELNNWKSTEEQTDDILIIGIKSETSETN